MDAAVTRQRESTDERRRAIAAAARALIVEKGFEGLRTRDIAERVGINIATLHYHVPTKEALIALVSETMAAEFRAQTLARPRSHLSPAEQLEHEFYDFEEMMTERKELIGLLSEMMERSRRDPAVAAGVKPLLRKWRELITAILAAGKADGTFRPDLDPVPAAQMLTGAMIGFCRGCGEGPSGFAALTAELRRAVRNPSSELSK
ncbi:MAG TPA: TetR/AcrR family transcriptional regulator [Devosia sp.]|nr:TetR/AcrR family transcriptional regulator [Devosia sp.]